MNEEHLTEPVERAIQRIMAINWKNLFDYLPMESYKALIQEYLRLSALWAKAINATEDWPLVNISAYLFPELSVVKPAISQLELHLRNNVGVNTWTTLTCLWYVRWSAIKEHEKVTQFNLDDPFEPLIRFYELGGYLRIENKVIDTINISATNWRNYDSLEPFIDWNEFKPNTTLQTIMTPKITIQELAIALTAKNHSPTLLNADFLKYSGIVPADWELARPPIFSPQISQVSFTNGTNIVAQSNAITFIESISTKSQEEPKIPAIIRKYVEALPRTDYQTLSVNPRTFVTFEGGDENAAREYVTSTLLSKGTWFDIGKAPVKAAVNLVYSLERGELNLSVAEALLQLQDSEPTPAVLFSGAFQYEITGELEGEKLQSLYRLLENWQPDLEAYREIVNKRLLPETAPELVPAA